MRNAQLACSLANVEHGLRRADRIENGILQDPLKLVNSLARSSRTERRSINAHALAPETFSSVQFDPVSSLSVDSFTV